VGMKRLLGVLVCGVGLFAFAESAYAMLVMVHGAEDKPCTTKIVRGRSTTCMKLPAGCWIDNKDNDTGMAAISLIEREHKVAVEEGDLVLCNCDDFYGTPDGTIIKDLDTGVQYKFNSKSEKFSEAVSKEAKPSKKKKTQKSDQTK
jgi:hypothetical protein